MVDGLAQKTIAGHFQAAPTAGNAMQLSVLEHSSFRATGPIDLCQLAPPD
jgi:hypothetical protein